MKANVIIFFCLFSLTTSRVKAQVAISGFENFVAYAKTKSLSLQQGQIRILQAKKAKIAAIYGILDPTGSVSGSFTNNTEIPVTPVPGEVLGGQPGTFEAVKFGIQYVTDFNAYAELKLLHLEGWENMKLSKLNLELQQSNNQIDLKNLYENIAVIYFNIETLQEQLISTKNNLLAAETLYKNTLEKYQQGVVKQQDVNDSEVNLRSVEENIRQIEFLIRQQYIALKLLCDIPEEEMFQIEPSLKTYEQVKDLDIMMNPFLIRNAMLSEKMAWSTFRKSQYGFYPTVSLFASYANQQFNTQAILFDNNVNWYPSEYVGVRIRVPLPSATAISQSSKARYDYLIAKNNREKLEIKTKLNTRQLQTEYEKAFSHRNSNEEIYLLRKDTYEKNLNNYKEGIISLEQTINSFNALVSSEYNLISSEKSIEMTLSKIKINNNID